MGNLVSSEGLKPDPKKAIVNMTRPMDVTSLQRLLGMVTWHSAFPMSQQSEWAWYPEHDKALDNLKAVLTSKPAHAFYDVTKPVTIQADASQSGLVACIPHIVDHELYNAYPF